MSQGYSSVVKTAQDYYNSDDADNFYYHVWGGEDIHIGIYAQLEEDIADASQRTVSAMASQSLMNLSPQTRVLDVGAGYGGAARWLAANFGCHVTCLNLSETQKARNRAMTAEQELADRIVVIHHGEKIAEGEPEVVVRDKAVIDAYLGEAEVNVKS